MGLSAGGLSNTVIRVFRVLCGSKNLPINRDGPRLFSAAGGQTADYDRLLTSLF
jgi:hypothetical protein